MERTGRLSPQQPIICVVGPTAVGKTALAISLAHRFGGEVINADSRQIYRGMTIGTAKPSIEELAAVPHHLVDILDPSEDFGLSLFLQHAAKALQGIRTRGRLPIVCGGTGQYVWGLLEGRLPPEAPPDPMFRAALEAEAERVGVVGLHRQLAAIDQARAAALDPRNVRRVIRALEIHRATGKLPSLAQPGGSPSLADAMILGLTMPRETLYRRIDDRVDRMMRDGFLAEVEELLKAGFSTRTGPMASPGYRELGLYLEGELSLEEAVARAKTQTHRLARRQYTWFKPSDDRIQWLDATEAGLHDTAARMTTAFLETKSWKIDPL